MTEKTLRVLVVDDDMMARMTAVQCLKQQGHTARMADGGAKAMEMLRAEHFDLVLLDLLMPEVNGFQVLAELKADTGLRGIPVIVISGTDEADSIAKCITIGALGHLSKPLDPTLLADRISACLAKDT